MRVLLGKSLPFSSNYGSRRQLPRCLCFVRSEVTWSEPLSSSQGVFRYYGSCESFADYWCCQAGEIRWLKASDAAQRRILGFLECKIPSFFFSQDDCGSSRRNRGFYEQFLHLFSNVLLLKLFFLGWHLYGMARPLWYLTIPMNSEVPNTEDNTNVRRGNIGADIIFTSTMVLQTTKDVFLSDSVIKQRLIQMLSDRLVGIRCSTQVEMQILWLRRSGKLCLGWRWHRPTRATHPSCEEHTFSNLVEAWATKISNRITQVLAYSRYTHLKSIRVPAHYLYVYSDLAYSGQQTGLTTGTQRVTYVPNNQARAHWAQDNTHSDNIVRWDSIV